MLSWSRAVVSPVLAGLIVGSVQGRAADVSRIELLPLQTVTVTEEQFLTGSRDGRPVTIAVAVATPVDRRRARAGRGPVAWVRWRQHEGRSVVERLE